MKFNVPARPALKLAANSSGNGFESDDWHHRRRCPISHRFFPPQKYRVDRTSRGPGKSYLRVHRNVLSAPSKEPVRLVDAYVFTICQIIKIRRIKQKLLFDCRKFAPMRHWGNAKGKRPRLSPGPPRDDEGDAGYSPQSYRFVRRPLPFPASHEDTKKRGPTAAAPELYV